MLNARLRLTQPVWSEEVDNGGMFSAQLSVHEDPDGGKLPFLVVCRDGWGGGSQARRATLEEARRYAGTLHEQMFG